MAEYRPGLEAGTKTTTHHFQLEIEYVDSEMINAAEVERAILDYYDGYAKRVEVY